MKVLLALLASALLASAGQPQLKPLRVEIGVPSVFPVGASNCVYVVYKATSLGTVFTPFKPTAIFPATRTNTTILVLPGLYHFYATAQCSGYPESDPSNYCTNNVP